MTMARVKTVLIEEGKKAAARGAVLYAPIVGGVMAAAHYTAQQAQAMGKVATQLSGDNITPEQQKALATQAEGAANNSSTIATVESATAAAVLGLMAFPEILSNWAHAPVKTAGLMRHALNNWDHYLGRALQTAGSTVEVLGFTYVRGNADTALPLLCVGPMLFHVGNNLIALNKLKAEQAALAASQGLPLPAGGGQQQGSAPVLQVGPNGYAQLSGTGSSEGEFQQQQQTQQYRRP